MTKTKTQIKEAMDTRGITTPLTDEVVELATILDKVKGMEQLWSSEGGQALLDGLRDSAVASLNNVRQQMQDPDLGKITATLSQYFAIIDLISTLRRVKKRDEIQTQLDNAILRMR